MPALGFGMGLERVLLAVADAAESYEPTLALFVAALGAEARRFALPLAHRLRLAGIRTEIEHRDDRPQGVSSSAPTSSRPAWRC